MSPVARRSRRPRFGSVDRNSALRLVAAPCGGTWEKTITGRPWAPAGRCDTGVPDRAPVGLDPVDSRSVVPGPLTDEKPCSDNRTRTYDPVINSPSVRPSLSDYFFRGL